MDERELVQQRDVLIKQKKEEIKKLQKELKELQDDDRLVNMVDIHFHRYRVDEHRIYTSNYTGFIWNKLREFVMQLCAERYTGVSGKYRNCWKNYTHEEKRICAECAQEIIPIFNKYYDKIYEKEVRD